jgi:hypothetical protein
MSLQDDSSEVPNFEARMTFYIKNRWTGLAAWNDFRKILDRFQDEIVWEGGRLKFNIPNFRIKSFTEDIFLKLMYDLESKLSKETWVSPGNPSGQTVRHINVIRERAVSDHCIGIQGLEDIITAPAMFKSDPLAPAVTTYKLLSRGFETGMEETLLQSGYGKFGLGELEFEIRLILTDFFRKVSKDANSEILWCKAPGSLPLDPEGNLMCQLSVVTSDDMGKVFRRALTTNSVLSMLIRHVETNLSDEILKNLVLTFEVWTPYHGEVRPYHKGKKGIVAKISRP